ncbi:MAG: PEP-CTERM sorting domain-containing protein [Rhodocyclaceae bacterium]|nr:PEP-CTERM sorting domain-containing protein [Rhodocyclaceae bacterium]
MRLTVFSTLAFAAALQAAPAFAGSPYSALYVFGDSLSDNGNMFSFTGGASPSAAAGYWNGRYSNGPVAVETMARGMEVPLYDSAYGGAKTGPNPAGGADHINAALTPFQLGVLGQVGRATAPAGSLDSSALYLLWGGPNDIFAMGATPPAVTVGTAVANMVQAAMQLYADGAKHFYVPLMPDLGLTPASRAGGPVAMAGATALTDAYNAALRGALANVDAATPDMDIKFFDSASFLRATVADPAGHGFTNVTAPCIGGDCTGYLFFDGVHPTALAHGQLGIAFAAAVPEPETYAMFLAGLGILGAVARRKRLA